VNELREDLDRALRAVTFGAPPVEQAKRAGRRIRARRRAALLAGALAVAAIAAGYPALARSAAAPPAPASGHAPAPSQPAGHDPVITAGPGSSATEAPGGLASKDGVVAAGTLGGVLWQVTVDGPNAANPVPADPCYGVALSSAAVIGASCMDLPTALSGDAASNGHPAAFTGAANSTTVAIIGEVAPDVTYLIVTFTDGQQLKLTPVTAHGYRYVAWVAPLSMTIHDVVAHLGGPYSDSGQAATAVPFDLPGQLPLFGLWQLPGQAAQARATRVIGGTVSGHPWSVAAYVGPWGTCVTGPPGTGLCVPLAALHTTMMFGDMTSGGTRFITGAAAPGVAYVQVALSNGKTVRARPVTVGGERLFAVAVAKGVTDTGWTAYDAAGHQAGAGVSVQASATKPASR
jgi:hypothetical protein